MAISFINRVSSTGTSATWPAHQVGDLLIVFAYRNTTTAPALPAGYTLVNTNSGNVNSYTVGYKIATSTSEAFGTWSQAGIVTGHIYRGALSVAANAGNTKAANAVADIPGLTLSYTDGTSWVVVFAGSRGTGTQGNTLNGSTTSRGTQVGTTAKTIGADTNGSVSSFVATTSSNNGTIVSSGVSIEISIYGTPSVGGNIKVYSGSSFVAKPVKVYNGSMWATKPLKVYNGSNWVETSY